jgi:ABC-type dipeptide/oligopeptide/nickel transport system ATPase component
LGKSTLKILQGKKTMNNSNGYVINGTKITVPAGSFSYQEEDFSKDYNLEVDLVNSKLKNLPEKEKVVIISGVSGSGKSLLATVLQNTISGSELIDQLDSYIGGKRVSLALPLASSADVTYIVDGLEFVTQESSEAFCKSVLDVGGSVIVLTQSDDDLQEMNGARLTLTRNDLVEN